MSVADNIMDGQHHLLKNKFITGSLYWFTGAQGTVTSVAPRSLPNDGKVIADERD
jgi:hypothetical protein